MDLTIAGLVALQSKQGNLVAITLTPEQERLVSQALETGAYRNPDEVIDHALEVLRSQDDWLLENKNAINTKIERAIAQLDRGEGIPGDVLQERFGAHKET